MKLSTSSDTNPAEALLAGVIEALFDPPPQHRGYPPDSHASFLIDKVLADLVARHPGQAKSLAAMADRIKGGHQGN